MHQQTCFSACRRSMWEHARLQGWMAAAHVFFSLSLSVFFKATGGRFILKQLVSALNGEVILMVGGERFGSEKTDFLLMLNSLSRSPAEARSKPFFSLFFCRRGQHVLQYRNNTEWRKVSARNDTLVKVCGLRKEKKRNKYKNK